MYNCDEFSWLMPILMIIFFGLLFYLAFSNLNTVVRAESAVDIAKRRFSNGEISAEELDKIKNKL